MASGSPQHPTVKVTDSLRVFFVDDHVQLSLYARQTGGEFLSAGLIMRPEVARALGNALVEMANLAPEAVPA